MAEETELLISTTITLPENRTPAALDLLKSSMRLMDDMLKQSPKPAAILGHKGGSSTARKLGTEHYRRMAAARKTRLGGRPRKQADHQPDRWHQDPHRAQSQGSVGHERV